MQKYDSNDVGPKFLIDQQLKNKLNIGDVIISHNFYVHTNFPVSKLRNCVRYFLS